MINDYAEPLRKYIVEDKSKRFLFVVKPVETLDDGVES